MFDILHILGKSSITLLRTSNILAMGHDTSGWRWVMIHLREGEVYVFLRVVHAARDVVTVKINCTRVADTDPTIALRRNWSCLDKRIWSRIGEGVQHWAKLSVLEDMALSRQQSQVNHTRIRDM